MRKNNTRTLVISIFVILISVYNYTRLTGSECIRAIHIVTLLVCGMGIGIFLISLIALLRNKSNK